MLGSNCHSAATRLRWENVTATRPDPTHHSVDGVGAGPVTKVEGMNGIKAFSQVWLNSTRVATTT